ncbi:MAG: ATP-dependent RecD-like DNA helicase [Clostridiales bacterium]|nr:ATP-dependent RecD-like DNA helicase [Clostridiales bacterium]
MERIAGTVEEIRFRNDENGYTVLVIDDNGDMVVAAGLLPTVAEGDCLELEGEFVIHPRFGTQFKVERASVTQPKTMYGIMKFLSSGLIDGVGEKTAARIVDMFGFDTIEVITKSPEALTRVKGISAAKAKKISEQFESVRLERETAMFLAGYGISVNLAMKLYAIYGGATIDTVKSDPYVLVEDVDGVGFLTADKIAQSMGIRPDSEFRLRAGLLYALKSACEKEGDTYLPNEKLFERAKAILGEENCEFLSTVLDKLLVERKVVIPFEGAIMDSRYHKTEKTAAVRIVKRVDEAGFFAGNIDEIIDRFERTNNITLHEKQREAVSYAVKSGVSVITGGPGTGKTTIINCILFVLDFLNCSSILLAPTGRAAKRMTEGCNREASTIHRAILSLTEGEKLSAGAVIVDEFSMVDIFLFNMLLGAVADTAKLIIVGDSDQLPSVGAGNVLRDIISSKLVPVTRLSYIYRQSQTSRIAVNAHAINNGEMPDLSARDGDFFFFKQGSPAEVANMTVELATKRITDYSGIDPSRIQVIAALKAGVAGVNNLNQRLQAALNGSSKVKTTVGDINFFVGDRVMHTVNNYELTWRRGSIEGEGVFNGDIGIVEHIMPTGEIEVLFEDGRRVTYSGENKRQLILSYAVTVHKSQGCEFDAIVMPIVSGPYVIMTRNLLYTAITRAKRMAVLVGDRDDIRRMVNNNYVAERYSALDIFIADAKSGMRRLFGDC